MKPHWKVNFMRRGFEPPMPFGKSCAIVAANSRAEAVEILRQSGQVSPHYPKVTASQTDAPVDYHFQYTEIN